MSGGAIAFATATCVQAELATCHADPVVALHGKASPTSQHYSARCVWGESYHWRPAGRVELSCAQGKQRYVRLTRPMSMSKRSCEGERGKASKKGKIGGDVSEEQDSTDDVADADLFRLSQSVLTGGEDMVRQIECQGSNRFDYVGFERGVFALLNGPRRIESYSFRSRERFRTVEKRRLQRPKSRSWPLSSG